MAYIVIGKWIHDLGFLGLILTQVNFTLETVKEPFFFLLGSIWGGLKIMNEFKKYKQKDK